MTRAESSRESDVVDFRVGAPIRTSGKRDLVLAGKIVETGITREFLVECENERRYVREFMGMDAGERAAGDVARNVAASASGA